MRTPTFFASLLLLLGSAVAAVPVAETATVSEFSVARNQTNAGVRSVSFKLTSLLETLECQKDLPSPYDVNRCGDSDYHYKLAPGSDEKYSLFLFHQLPNGDLSGRGDIPTECGAGADNRYVCQQTGPTEIPLDAELFPNIELTKA